MSHEQFSENIATLYAAKRLMQQGYFFKILPDQVSTILDITYEKYPDELQLDDEIIQALEETLSTAANSITLVRTAYVEAKAYLKLH